MPRKKPSPTCSRRHCTEAPYLGGLCVRHHEDARVAEELRHEAVRALHWSTIDENFPTSTEIRDELYWVQGWWRQVSDALNFGRKNVVLRDEVEAAKEWCIALTEQLVLWDRRIRSGQIKPEEDHTLTYMLQSVRERFGNLEKGLMSNGVSPPSQR